MSFSGRYQVFVPLLCRSVEVTGSLPQRRGFLSVTPLADLALSITAATLGTDGMGRLFQLISKE